MIPAFAPIIPVTVATLFVPSLQSASTGAAKQRKGRGGRWSNRVQMLLALALTLLPSAASADQLGWLRHAVRNVREVAADVGSAAGDRTPDAAARSTGSAHCLPVKTGTPLPAPGPRPPGMPEVLWPADCAVSNLDHYDFSRAQRLADAYHAASAIQCQGCAVTHDDMVYGSLTDRQFGYQLGEWPTDRDVVRRARRYVNIIHPVGEFMLSGERCKVFQWTLRDGDRQLAEKYSLLCLFAGSYQHDRHWNVLVL